ncbi:MAG TPA: type II toxin-antitoxin system HicA family toxin [Prolixibacteraceae bacterium]|mgnify:CR=1 FL=1|nr:type II toxin-antitoxin system HicA family toxin [Prolixibacteraceae bacterium]
MIHLHNVSSHQLIKALWKLGYEPTRQTGSHIRMTVQDNGHQHITVPRHDPLRVGTLNAILNEVASQLGISKRELIDKIF